MLFREQDLDISKKLWFGRTVQQYGVIWKMNSCMLIEYLFMSA